MKKLSTILFFVTLTFISCKKDTEQTNPVVQNEITYPDSIYYGKNILSFADSTVLVDQADYEMGATLEKDASLYLIITNYSDTLTTMIQPIWYFADESGWSVNNYNDLDSTQKFTATQSGKIDLKMFFIANSRVGRCKIDFYENGNTITRTKYFTWQ